MKLISFDIGIKNMAYCIFTISPENKTVSVQDWNILNLIDRENAIIKKTCSCQLAGKPAKKKAKLSNTIITPFFISNALLHRKVGENELKGNVAFTESCKICGKSAKYEKGDQTFCEMHAKKSASENLGYIIPTKEISPPSLKKMSKEELIHLGTIKYSIFSESQKSTIKTKKGCLDILLPYFQEHCFVPILVKKGKGAGEVDLITIGRNMRNRLNELSQNQLTDTNCHIIMENQISPLAGRMKTVQGMLTQYYIMQEQNNQSIHIEYISSANKLKDLVVVPDKSDKDKSCTDKSCTDKSCTDKSCTDKSCTDKSCDNLTSVQEKYKQHKTDSIQICTRFLTENPDLTSPSWTTNFSNSGKKDDLADCFLQGIWYLKREKIISYAENLKINIV